MSGGAIEEMLELLSGALNNHVTADDLRPVAHFLGECVVRCDTHTLARFHDTARQLRRISVPDSWVRGFADNITGLLDGYFATLEPIERMENLMREVGGHPLWRAILRVLDMDKDGRWSEGAVCEAIRIHESEVVSSELAIAVALQDMQTRELVEYFPSFLNQNERVYSLGRLGCELHVKLTNG